MRLVPLHALTDAELSAWEELARRAVEPNPFFERPFVTSAASALDAADVQLMISETPDGAWSGCMPARATLLGGRLLLSSWRHPYSFLGTPLVDRERLGEFGQAFVESVGAGANGRFTMLRRSSEGPVVAAIRAAARESGRAQVISERGEERALLERRPEPTYLDDLKAHHRREMRRLRRRLGDELGGEVVVRDRAGDPTAGEEFLRLEASGWKGREGTAMAQSEGAARLFREICAEFAAQGRLQMLSLEAGGRVTAMKCNISAGDTLFCFKIAFDESLKRYSPGIQLEIDNVDAFHARGEARMDSCAESTNEMVNRLWPERRAIVTLLLSPTGPVGWLAGRALGLGYAARSRRRTKSKQG